MAACLAALSLAASASPAAAAVTLGQLAPGSPPPAEDCTIPPIDRLQPTVTSGNTYVVPATVATGTVTSWSHNAAAGAGQMLAMKIFRKVGDPNAYEVVGHDGPRALTPGGTAGNTFPASIPVRAGDVLGMNDTTTPNACIFSVPGETSLFRVGDLADGASGSFSSGVDFRLNVTAAINPTNTFTLGGKTTRNKKKGTATLTVNVPNPGELVLSGKGVKGASTAGAVVARTVTAPGGVKLTIRAKGKKKRKLNKNGKVKVKPIITYTPTGGDSSTQSKKLKLKKKL